jgi:tetratricopeptide (TPR) repeat protein
MKATKSSSKTSSPTVSPQQKPATSVRTRAALFGLLALLAIVWAATLPLRQRMAAETAQLRRATDAREAAAAQQRQAQTAMEQARQSVEAAPRDPQRRLAYAEMLSQAGNRPEAAAQLLALLQIAPNNVEAHAALGELYDFQRKEDLAIAEYQRALALDPHNARALKDLAYRYIGLGWNRPADALLARALQEHPNDPQLHVVRGMAAFQSNNYTLAERELIQARQIAPNDPNILSPLIEVYRQDRRYDRALQTIAQALPQAADKGPLLLERAQVYNQMQDADRTLAAVEEALKLAPNNTRAHYLRGMALRQKGDLTGAARELALVYQQDPTFEKVGLLLGQLRTQQGQAAEGQKLVDAYTRANSVTEQQSRIALNVMLKPNSPEAHLALGRSYLDGGNPSRAIVELKRALELKPGDAATRDLLVHALRAAGRGDEVAAIH